MMMVNQLFRFGKLIYSRADNTINHAPPTKQMVGTRTYKVVTNLDILAVIEDMCRTVETKFGGVMPEITKMFQVWNRPLPLEYKRESGMLKFPKPLCRCVDS